MEAVRRETFITALVSLNQKEDYIEQYRTGSPEERTAIEVELADKVKKVLSRNISQMAVPTAREILYMFEPNGEE